MTLRRLLDAACRATVIVVGIGLGTASADPGSARIQPLPEKISVGSVPMILDPVMVPTDPGPGRDATLAGIDSNRNGIRDEVERWIAENYPNCSRFRAALAQVALAAQRRMSTGDLTEEVALRLATEERSATACFAADSESCETATLEKFIEFSVLLQNTPERGRAYLRVFQKIGKKMFEIPAEGCAIPPEQSLN